MKFLILFLILCQYSQYTKGQSDFTKTYYPKINQAELAIVNGNYKEALEHYDAAFTSVNNLGFGKDYYNATICCDIIGESDLGFEYLEKMIGKGVERIFFTSNVHHFENFHKEIRWVDIMTEYEIRQYETFGKTKSNYIMGELGEILFKDNESREARSRGEKIDILKQDEENIAKFLKIVESNGFPREEEIGMRNATDINNDYYSFLIIHHLRNRAIDREKVDLRPKIKDWIRSGRLYPDTGLDFLNLGNGLLSKGNSTTYGQIYLLTFSGDKSYYSINYTEEEKEKINFERSILGLSTIEEYQIKQIFQAENGLRENRFRLAPVFYDSYPIEFKEEMTLKKLVDKN